jgi:hypothetical protein
MNRVKTFCPQCELEIEIHAADHLTPAGFHGRCGNCFYPFSEADVAASTALHEKLKAHDEQRADIIRKHIGG